jgi:hypothetical protein
MSEVNVIVSVDDLHLPDILEVAQALRKAGVKVEQIMDTVGVITGSCNPQTVSNLAQIDGVAAVEEEQGYQLPPPDSEIQ